jgi:hypothetical protein
MLQVFHLYVAKVDLDVAYVLQWLHACFKYFQVFCKCFRHMLASVSVVFGHILQAFHLNVAKVNLVLHMLQWDPSPATSARAPGLPCEPLRLADASTVQSIGGVGDCHDPHGRRRRGKQSKDRQSQSGAGGPHVKRDSRICLDAQQVRASGHGYMFGCPGANLSLSIKDVLLLTRESRV